jgi:hypothetical protein
MQIRGGAEKGREHGWHEDVAGKWRRGGSFKAGTRRGCAVNIIVWGMINTNQPFSSYVPPWARSSAFWGLVCCRLDVKCWGHLGTQQVSKDCIAVFEVAVDRYELHLVGLDRRWWCFCWESTPKRETACCWRTHKPGSFLPATYQGLRSAPRPAPAPFYSAATVGSCSHAPGIFCKASILLQKGVGEMPQLSTNGR